MDGPLFWMLVTRTTDDRFLFCATAAVGRCGPPPLLLLLARCFFAVGWLVVAATAEPWRAASGKYEEKDAGLGSVRRWDFSLVPVADDSGPHPVSAEPAAVPAVWRNSLQVATKATPAEDRRRAAEDEQGSVEEPVECCNFLAAERRRTAAPFPEDVEAERREPFTRQHSLLAKKYLSK